MLQNTRTIFYPLSVKEHINGILNSSGYYNHMQEIFFQVPTIKIVFGSKEVYVYIQHVSDDPDTLNSITDITEAYIAGYLANVGDYRGDHAYVYNEGVNLEIRAKVKAEDIHGVISMLDNITPEELYRKVVK